MLNKKIYVNYITKKNIFTTFALHIKLDLLI